ncbi:MAG: Ni,Fe-hydrogenase III large subunit [Gammaproteobacteria bacterium]|nr:MAG: Ni,Fe-hydrogenase III large subunit [Gammaproteobacteria bacterium]
MNRFDWLSEYLARLEDEHVLVHRGHRGLPPTHTLLIDAEDWGRAAEVAHGLGMRWCAAWGDPHPAHVGIFACLEFQGDYLLLQTEVPWETPVLSSHTPHYPAANRPERHLQDLLGVAFTDHPDARRWTRHAAWPEGAFPLRPDFPPEGLDAAHPTPPDGDYPFEAIRGAGIHEIPVGPVHAGIIEPGHFRFQAVGEKILRMEERLGYVHKGIEKRAVGMSPERLVRLAARVSGDTAVGHAWAACQALERATGTPVPGRALYLRALLAERERVANHLGDIGAICNDVGFAFAQAQCSRLREAWLRRNAELFGHRLLMDTLCPGGVQVDLDARGARTLQTDHAVLREAFSSLYDLLEDQPSLEDRLVDTGILTTESAVELGVVGYVARASGVDFDLRRDNPYLPYTEFPIPVAVAVEGDVAARVRIRAQELLAALEIMDRLLEALPDTPLHNALRAVPGEAAGFGAVESWRGETLCYVRLDPDGRVARYFPRDASWLNWPALERIVMGNIVADFPVCNKSVNGSYSGCDL